MCPHRERDRLFGDVGSALVTDRGNVYRVCIDIGSGTGFCAEASAIAAMVTAREYRITKIVAVWKDESGTLYVLPPCGRCRLFIEQMHPANLERSRARERVCSATRSPSAHRLA